MDPDTIRSLRSRIRKDLLPYCEGGSMIPVDLSASCEGRIYDPNGSGIQILGIRSRDPFLGSTDMSAHKYWTVGHPTNAARYTEGAHCPTTLHRGSHIVQLRYTEGAYCPTALHEGAYCLTALHQGGTLPNGATLSLSLTTTAVRLNHARFLMFGSFSETLHY